MHSACAWILSSWLTVAFFLSYNYVHRNEPILSVAPPVCGLGVFWHSNISECTLNHLGRKETHCCSPPCCPTGHEMTLPHHIALGQHDNWGRLFVSRWLCKSLQRVFGVGACKRTSLSHQPASLGAKCCANYCMTPPSISVLMEIHNLWHILVSASGDLNAIILLKWDLIGQLLSHFASLKSFLQVPLYSRYNVSSSSRMDVQWARSTFPQNGIVKLWLRITLLYSVSISAIIIFDTIYLFVFQFLHHLLYFVFHVVQNTPPNKKQNKQKR